METAADGYQLTRMDRKLIQLTQEGLPLVSRPFDVLALELGITSSEVQARFARMQAFGSCDGLRLYPITTASATKPTV